MNRAFSRWLIACLALGCLFPPVAGAEDAAATLPAPQAAGPATPTDRVVQRFMALDTDESLGVSFEEYMAMVRARAGERFKAMDANGDGEVTDEEFRAFWTSRKAHWYRLRR